MPHDPMYGAKLKLERAQHHINDVESTFGRYVADNAKLLGAYDYRERKDGFDFITALPHMLPAIVGDAIHNLRVCLDHAYWVLVERNGGLFTRHVKFPFGGDKASVLGSINGQPVESKPSKEVIDFIIGQIEPWPSGKMGLYDIHSLDITDKHQLLIDGVPGRGVAWG